MLCASSKKLVTLEELSGDALKLVGDMLGYFKSSGKSCFPGSSSILTPNGYAKFESLPWDLKKLVSWDEKSKKQL